MQLRQADEYYITININDQKMLLKYGHLPFENLSDERTCYYPLAWATKYILSTVMGQAFT